jgi:hypothetical protein
MGRSANSGVAERRRYTQTEALYMIACRKEEREKPKKKRGEEGKMERE